MQLFIPAWEPACQSCPVMFPAIWPADPQGVPRLPGFAVTPFSASRIYPATTGPEPGYPDRRDIG